MVAENPELAAGPSTAATRRRRAPSAAVGTPRRSVGAVLAWAWIPLTAAYLLVLAWHLPAVIERASWNADNANMLNLSRELGDLGPGERVNMGNAPNYTTLWLNQGLYGLTGSGTLVEFAPLIWYAIAVALIVWSVAATAGRLAAGLTAGILICLSEVSLELVTSHAVHGATWFTVAALGALVVLVGRSRDVRPRACVAVALAAGILAGANAASDPLALPVAIVPAVIAIAALWLTAERRNRIAAPAAAFVVAVVVSMPVVGAIGTSRGIVADLPPGNLATVDQMWGSFLQSIDNAASFFGPAPLGAPVSGVGLLRLVVGLAGIAGVVATAAFGIRLARRWHAEPAARSVASPRDALRIYWAASLLVGGAAVLTSPLAFEVRESSVRYEFNLFLAAAVGLPLWLLGRGRRGVGTAAALVALIAVVGIQSIVATRDDRRAFAASGMVADAPEAIAFARSQGATRGYAGYWNASALRWKTGTSVAPVANCETKDGLRLCVQPLAAPPGVLRPRRQGGSFLIVDHQYPGAPEDRFLAYLGPWAEHRQFGGVFVAVYPYDIGTRLARG